MYTSDENIACNKCGKDNLCNDCEAFDKCCNK
jgi:hypothetical protein